MAQIGDKEGFGTPSAKRPAPLGCACCGLISLCAAVSCIAVLTFRTLVLTVPLARWISEAFMIAFFFAFATITWPPERTPCCYASCSDWCCDCRECCACEESADCHACDGWGACLCIGPCLVLAASPGCCASCRDKTCYRSFLAALLGWLTFLDMLSSVWSCWADMHSWRRCEWSGFAGQIPLELLYAPLLFIFVLWNIAGYVDRRLHGMFEVTGYPVLAHRARAEQLVTDALAWGPFLVIQAVCAMSIGGVLVGTIVIVQDVAGDVVSTEATMMWFFGGIPVTVWVFLLSTFGDCRLQALWAAACRAPSGAVVLAHAQVPPEAPLPQEPARPVAGGGAIHHFKYKDPEYADDTGVGP